MWMIEVKIYQLWVIVLLYYSIIKLTKQYLLIKIIFLACNLSDAAKRKQLPAWIREGLEKMEREKRRKIEHEQSFDEPDYSSFINENVTQELPDV